MKRHLLIIAFVISAVASRAQIYGNEWIDYTQVYYKIQVVADGVYRVPYSTLASYIQNLGSINVKDFVVFHNGQAVPLFISSTTTMGPSDYIDFYGRKNIGDIDSVLYRSAVCQPHPYYSLFTDTSVYYLSLRTVQGNPRLTPAVNNLTGLPPQETYFIYPSRQIYTAQNTQGVYFMPDQTDEVYRSIFDTGEGFFDINYFGSFVYGQTNQTNSLTYNVPTPFVYTAGPQATFIASYFNNSPEAHTTDVQVGSNVVYTQHYDGPAIISGAGGFHLNRVNVPISLSLLGSSTTPVTYTAPDNATSYQQNAVYMNEIDYPHSYYFGNANIFDFQVAGDPVNRKYIVLNNFNDNGLQPVLYDLTNGLAINSTVAPANAPQFALPVSPSARELVVFSGDPSSYNTVGTLTPISFTNYSSANSSCQGNYLIIADTSVSDSGLWQDVDGDGYNEVTDYMRYRDVNYNPVSGKYHARIFDIEQLYDQFAYGVRKSPLAIRNFVQYALANWNIKPQYVFIIGKGREYPDMRSPGMALSQCRVPTWGQPPSDNLLVTTRNNDVPSVAVGRLAAITAQQVHDYLQKIMVYEDSQSLATYVSNEDIPPKIYQKQVLHFSGGTTWFEQQIFGAYLTNDSLVVVDTFWGAHVTDYRKTTSAPISQAEAQVIMNQIDSGVSLVTFFGHSATGAFDLSIDEPESYTNVGKYPFIFSNGCYSGLIFDSIPGYSERFVLEADKGAIGFMATSDLSISSGLNNFSSTLYDTLSLTSYTNTFGNCVKQTLKTMFTNPNYSGDAFTQVAAYEMTFHGDPAMYLNQYPKPDYALARNHSSVYFTPTVVSPGSDSFKVNVIVTNLGKAIKTNIVVQVQRQVFDQNNNPVPTIVYKKTIAAPYYIDTVSFTMPTQISSIGNGQTALGYGQNIFYVLVDAGFTVNEMVYGNNGDTITMNIQGDDVIPIYPYDLAIDSDKVKTLKASTTNPFAAFRKYDFQIDTTMLFNSPLLQSGYVSQVGGVLHWTPHLTYRDSVVYYWRVKIDTAPVSSYNYRSFMHMPGQYGWNQSHFWQFLEDSYIRLSLDSTSRVFKFPPTLNNITVVTGQANAASPPGPVDFETMGWNYNNSNMYRYRMGGCGFTAGITFAVIDSSTGNPWVSYNNDQDNWGDLYGNYMCNNEESFQYGFDFSTTGTHPSSNGYYANSSWNSGSTTWSRVIAHFINSIPSGDYVLIYSDNMVPYTSWDTTLLSALGTLGFQGQLFRSGSINGPFVYFTQKAHSLTYPNTFVYQQGYATGLSANINFIGNWYQGQVTSTVIGPAVRWGSIQWSKHTLQNPSVNKDTLDVIGINNNGVTTVLFSTTRYTYPIQNINAKLYPYLQLRLRTENDSLRTPAQLNYWRVLYQKPAEVAINPAAYYSLQDSSMVVGGTLKLAIGIENATKIRMDSLLVNYTLRDASFNTVTTSIRNSPMPGLDTLILKFSDPINKATFAGADQLTLEANPNGDHLEQYHFNNFAVINFNASANNANPLLDVTFDGQHIFNGDIVSAKPDILITLRDQSQYLALNDSSALNIYIIPPGGNIPLRINYDGTILKFYPADSATLTKSNKCQAEYKPDFTVDGTYELLVKDMDRTGNHSSNSEGRVVTNTSVYYDYKIDFQVINKPMITNVLNYPNPFSTSTRFVFTITGSELPDFMKIQIMTIRGIVVKEITEQELGPLHIGTNMTEYAWDGKDQFGSQLANGVYFYRVVTRLNNQQMNQMGTSYDEYFKKGIGKMVLVR